MTWTRIGGMTGLAVALAIGLALSLGLWGHWTASAQDTFTVNDDTSPAEGGCDTPDFETEDIEDAIDSALVADGDTLVICEGTYVGEVTVDKSLTIEGLASADREDVVVVSDGNGFHIQTDNVTIRHLKLAGPGATRQSQGGIIIGANDGEFSDLEITGFGWVEGTGIAAGIVSQGSGPSSDDTKVGPNNYIHDNNNGVMFWGGSRNSVFNNVIEQNKLGISLNFVDETYARENRLAWNGGGQIGVTGGSNAFLWNNDIHAAGNVGVVIVGGSSPAASANTLVQIGGSPEHANNFTTQLTTGWAESFYVSLWCGSENTVDATFNYWEGIESREDLEAAVFNDEFDAPPEHGTADCPDDDGAVVVHPFVTTPWAPSPTPTPTPSPTATATATGTPTPTATPSAARTVDLSPPGWHDVVWSGPNATDPATALACIAGDYSIAYAWEGPTAGFRRYVEGCAVPGICNMAPLNKYDTLLVNISAADVTCEMPVVP